MTAAKVFVEKGYSSTSLDEVADVLLVTRPALYYYFKSKQELLFTIMSTGMDYLEKEVMVPASEIDDPETRLEFVLRNHARLLTGKTYYLAAVTSHDTEDLNSEQRIEINKRYRAYFDFLRNTLEELLDSGKLQDVNLTGATFTILGMVIWLGKWFRPGGQISATAANDLVCGMAMNSVLLEPSSTRTRKMRIAELGSIR